MSTVGLSSGTDFLRDSAKAHFEKIFQQPTILLNSQLDANLSWRPSIQFTVNGHQTIVAEASETPYPLIFNMRRTDILNVQAPITVYCVCPEEAYLADQPSAKKLMADGYGLFTVDAQGTVVKRCGSIPLVMQITDGLFVEEIKGLPKKFRQRIAESFEKYKQNAQSGVADISEVVEATVFKAGKDAVAKGWVTASDVKPGFSAKTLEALKDAANLKNAAAAIGGAQSFISVYRNSAHHTPRNKKQAYTKYRDCRHGFLDGIKKIAHFRDSVKQCGLTGNLFEA
ncbi:hypothetical protein [Terrarubrum flagellatum]|uniref:hypothetical protein n=1 Tax=Terrirubrum flagellatum TaxID=2895980 RepID=UPI0031455625